MRRPEGQHVERRGLNRDVIEVEAGVLVLQAQQALREQRGHDDQHQRQSDLDGDEAASGGRMLRRAARLHQRAGIGAAGAPRRQAPEVSVVASADTS